MRKGSFTKSMRHRKPRRFRYHSNGRGQHSRNNGVDQGRLRSTSFSEMRERNNSKPHGNPERLFDKYSLLAKEALSSGDRILSENYLQHADHFMRIIGERALVKKQNMTKVNENLNSTEKKSSENIEVKKDPVIEEKK